MAWKSKSSMSSKAFKPPPGGSNPEMQQGSSMFKEVNEAKRARLAEQMRRDTYNPNAEPTGRMKKVQEKLDKERKKAQKREKKQKGSCNVM
jgi:hypothetical protein